MNSDLSEDEKTVHTWIVEKFSKLTQPNQRFCSRFALKDSNVGFKIDLYPNGTQYYGLQFTIANVWIATSIEAKFNCKLAIMKSNGEEWLATEGVVERRKFSRYTNNYLNPEIKIRRLNIFIAREQVLPNDQLTIRCEIWKYVEPDLSRIPKEYGSLLEDPIFSDVVCQVESKEFSLHRNILATESPVFRAMFTNDLEEAKTGKIKIPDISVEAFEQVLKFIYSGKIPDFGQFGLELFVFANKYQMEQLKNICEKSLSTNLNIESVIAVLLMADLHNAGQLKLKCFDFIKANSSVIQQHAQWKELKKNPNLLRELYKIIDLTVENLIEVLTLAESKRDSKLKKKCFKFYKVHSVEIDKQAAIKELENENPELAIKLRKQLIL